MSGKTGEIFSAKNPPVELSAKELQTKRLHNTNNNRNKTKNPLRLQTSKPSKNSVRIKPNPIQVHFIWALILTILCFFVVGPCWALYKTYELRRMIKRNEFEAATQLSSKISAVLVISTIIGAFAWTGFLFCSVGLLITGVLLQKNYI